MSKKSRGGGIAPEDNEQVNRQFFAPFAPPDWSLVVQRDDPRLKGKNWPPLGWEGSECPLDDSLEAARDWFDYLTHSKGLLAVSDAFQRTLHRRPRTDDFSVFVRDSWRLVRHLKDQGKVSIPEAEKAGQYRARDARAMLTKLKERLFEKERRDGKVSGLSSTAKAVLSIIREVPRKGKGIEGKKIVRELKKRKVEISDSTLRKHIIPVLKARYGVINDRARGGYLIP